jgi:Leucine-rich repeat (LRR) protein
MVNLAQASLCGNAYLAVLPESIGQCTKLEKLFLNDNALTFLPESFGELRALSKLYVNGNKLRYLPNSLGNLATLEELYLGDNCLSALPPSLSSCSSLKKLFAIRNKIRNLPPSLPPSLELFNLSHNALTHISESLIGSMPNLKFLHLSHNLLTDFPFRVLQVKQLRIFDIEGNGVLVRDKLVDVQQNRDRLIKAWTFSSGHGSGGELAVVSVLG